MTTGANPDRTTFRARTPEDLLALVPVLLGFEPRESVTMLSFGGPQPFHARLDLPRPEHVREACDALVRPAVVHRVDRVAVVLHSVEVESALAFGRRLAEDLDAAGVHVVEVLAANGERWWARGRDPVGVPYDVSAHPFVLRSVLRGDVVHRSREDLAATLAADEAGVARVQELVTSFEQGPCSSLAWVVASVRRRVEADEEPTDTEVACLLGVLDEPTAVDRLVDLVSRPDAARHARFWSAVVRRTPLARRAVPAGVLALAAWLSGHGALAWCALDVEVPEGRVTGLAAAVRTALEHALPPDAWWAQGVDDPA